MHGCEARSFQLAHMAPNATASLLRGPEGPFWRLNLQLDPESGAPEVQAGLLQQPQTRFLASAWPCCRAQSS